MSNGVRLDLTLNPLEETRFLRQNSNLIYKLSKTVHFTKTELDSLFIIYYKVSKAEDSKFGISKTQFMDILHKSFDMSNDLLLGRIIYTLHKSSILHITMETWAKAMSLFLRGTLDEKINFCFSVYDVFGDGSLNRETMFHFLKSSLLSQSGEDDAEDSVKDMMEVITKKMDLDRDGKISFADYKQTVLKQNMMLEAFGQCLPTRNAVYAFLTTFTTRIKKM